MELSEIDIERIARIVAEKLGPAAGIDDVKNVVAQVVLRLSGDVPDATETRDAGADLPGQPQEIAGRTVIVVNAFGLDRPGLEEELRSYAADKPVRLTETSSASVGSFRSVIAIIDYSNFKGDVNQLKFDLSKICEHLGFRAVVQDSKYYGI